jgi:hypothetical protein
MLHEYEGPTEQFIPRIKELGLNQLSDEYRQNMVRVFGEARLDLGNMTQSNFDKAGNYLKSPQKQLFEQMLAGILWYFPGRQLTKSMATKIEQIDKGSGHRGIYTLMVGFGGGDVEERKIRTYPPGVDKKNDHFYGALYAQNGHGFAPPINHDFAIRLRKFGFDEIPQLRAVARAIMSWAGLRGYTIIEQQDQSILRQLIDNSELGNTDEVKTMLRLQPSVARQALKPAVFPVHACVSGNAMSRLLGDLMYTFHASPKLDFIIFVNAFVNREKTALMNGVNKQAKSGA